ncbi:MAG: DUF2207 domain-containing protein [Clostridiaceae bacterium]|nr:DUF2207 domain-containing protein [Clostridiaceae bacterium]
MDITAQLQTDGSAEITEVWDLYAGSGTEWYLIQGNLGKMKIEKFSVTDETGRVYEKLWNWDVNRTLEEKAGKCGIVNNKNGDYELCFGIGNYGDHVFTVSYRMTNFVKGFDDFCGFNQRFVNDELSSSPEHISVTIKKPETVFTPDNIKVWAFGFEGTIGVKDGIIAAESDASLSSSNYVNIMCRFPREMFHTENIEEGSFTVMQEKAFEGSDYGKQGASGLTPFWRIWLLALAFLAVLIGILALLGRRKAKAEIPDTFEDSLRLFEGRDDKKSLANPLCLCGCLFLLILFPPAGCIALGIVLRLEKAKADYQYKGSGGTGPAYLFSKIRSSAGKDDGYERDIPLEGNICAIYSLLKMTGWSKSENDVIGAYLLRWLQQGTVELKNMKKGGLGGLMNKEAPAVVLKTSPDSEDPVECELFSLLTEASGADHILQEKEMYHWAENHFQEMKNWLNKASENGQKYMNDMGYLCNLYMPGTFHVFTVEQKAFTEGGRQQAVNLRRFQNYLKDFTLMQERSPVEVALWDDYLVTAQLFGMADKVAETFRSLYPVQFREKELACGMEGYDMVGACSVVHMISKAGAGGADHGARASGNGGASSEEGGGGYSGGGHGGGSR